MSNIRRAAKRDLNEPPIIEALRGAGAKVEPLNGGSTGVPDLLVGFRRNNYLLEVKHPLGEKGIDKRQKHLTDDQELWHTNWTGSSYVVRTADEALWAIGAISTPPCVQPNAKIERCMECGGPVHTCERPEPFGSLSDYACPRHPKGFQTEDGWLCGKNECGWKNGGPA